jgi:glycosyltransferase involved in cell wall biosynthesis
MEIIHIILGKAHPDRLNGVNKVVYHLATEQCRAGKQVEVWGITGQPVHDYPDRNFRTELFQAERWPFLLNSKLKQAILAKPGAVYHLHGGWIPVFSSLAGFLFRHQVRFVLTPHGAYNEIAMKKSYWRKRIYAHLFENKLLSRVHKVHSIGRSEVEGLGRLSPATKSFLLPYGFDFQPGASKSLKNQDFTIGFVGRLDIHTKGLDLLMKAFLQFQKTEPASQLWIIGDGEGKRYLESFIADHQVKNVVLWGKKFGSEKEELIGKMHVFAHPSRNEGLPTAVLEAASLCTPTIVTQATNVAEYVTCFQAGIAIENDNTDALACAMTQLYETYRNGEEDSYVSGAQHMLARAFSWPVLVEKFDELYR